MSLKLDDIEIFNESGEPVRMCSLWSNKPAVLVFVRHFG